MVRLARPLFALKRVPIFLSLRLVLASHLASLCSWALLPSSIFQLNLQLRIAETFPTPTQLIQEKQDTRRLGTLCKGAWPKLSPTNPKIMKAVPGTCWNNCRSCRTSLCDLGLLGQFKKEGDVICQCLT
ncbi:hypothetical protein B0T20DRAFT_146762 [Sordaria brevicollis]|uniref:Uncharacterized protein n=1 Tax=Sordaria brevicollis TaxID=83679 RepID=A0AAE0UE65_SORBR|nr:hypothetical protein B0T20DRAFT_146762 [Sordaria brevicollis]